MASRRARVGWILMLPTMACAPSSAPPVVESVHAALVGEEPVPEVRVYENHSSALIGWKRAGVQGRILVHLDGHVDFDWLPDDTVARIATASADELPDLEHHPYDMDGNAYSRFGIWNFIYPAALLGIVREMIWVVPDGTLIDGFAASQLAQFQLFRTMQMVTVREAVALRLEGRTLRGTLLGLPVTICELSDLPDLPEPVLLDIDIDYFTTRSAISQQVSRGPWTTPAEVIEHLRQRRVRTDLATLSLSMIGGFVPPSSRWLGSDMRDRLRMDADDDGPPTTDTDPARNLEVYEAWARSHPDNASSWFLLYRSLRALGRNEEAAAARASAVRLDPLLDHEELFEGDRRWINRDYEAALAYYDSYIERMPQTPFLAYSLRRKAGCLLRTGRQNEGIQTFWKVTELAPDHADSHKDLGIALRDAGRIDQALEELRLARRILPARAGYAMSMGMTYLMLGRLEEGIANLSDAVSLRPCWPEARRNLAMALVESGRVEEAAGHVQVGLTIHPGTPRLRQIATELQRRGVDVRRVKSISFE